MKNPFKKQSLTDTLINVGIGGGANVAIDYVWDMAGLDATLETALGADSSVSAETIKNVIKLAGGAIVGGMISNKYGRAAADGVAVVGASNLISGLMSGDKQTDLNNDGGKAKSGIDPVTGLPYGTIGALRRGKMGQRTWRKVSGVGNASFMGA